MSVRFHFHQTSFTLRKRKDLKTFLEKLFSREGFNVENLDYVFCTDKYLLKMNRGYLKHDTFTDILTFDLTEYPGSNITGEVYISAERVKENAQKFGVSFENELHRVIFHGALHLCGYHDKTVKEQKEMRNKENENLKKYFTKK